MDNLNQGPFHVGQRVVSLVTDKTARIKKGDVKTILSIFKMCCKWHVDVGLKSGITASFSCKFHPNSIYKLVKGGPIYPESIVFAPITEQYEDMTLSIAQSAKQTNEVPDKVLIPETINN